jgi:transposase
MGAITPAKRKKTARESAAKFGVTERTIRNWLAQPRADYLAEAEARRKTVIELKRQGLTRSQIAEHMGITANAVKCLYKRAKKAAKTTQP